MASVLDGSKAKTARRVIEVLEFFDEKNKQATVMDIVRRYNRPQSSTSELLASLVELGLLYKDAGSRSYTLTPRAAILGSLSQPPAVRDGRLSNLIDRLVAQTRLDTALLGMVGLNAQIFRWTEGSAYRAVANEGFAGGMQERLCGCAAGWLLLSTVKADRREGLIRRLNAEAPEHAKFHTSELSRQVQECGRLGYAIGPAGFDSDAQMVAVLLPIEAVDRPMVISFVFQPSDEIAPQALAELLQASVQRCLTATAIEAPVSPLVSSAA